VAGARFHSTQRLDHLLDHSVYLVALLAACAALVEVPQLLANHAPLGGGELERPEEVGCGLELGADGEQLVDDVLDAVEALRGGFNTDNSVDRVG